jgi:ABC-type sugar transport system substrate-binding protein
MAPARRRSKGLAAASVITALAVGTALAAAPGDLDGGFGFGGKVTTGIGEYGDDRATAVALDFDGKIVAVGASRTSFTVARYNADGTPIRASAATGR